MSRYDRILHTIFNNSNDRRNDQVLRLLGWLVCAKRSLRWNEIQGAVSIDIENSCVDWERRKLREDSKELCGSLVEIRSDGTIELVHRTAKLYVIILSLGGLHREAYTFSYLVSESRWVNAAAEELRISKLCLGYLSLRSFETDLSHLVIEANLLKGYYVFLDYAIVYWGQHLEAALPALSTAEATTAMELSESIEVFLELHWIEPKVEVMVPKILRERLNVFRGRHYFEKLSKAMAVSKRQLNVYGELLDDECVLHLIKIRQQIQHVLENANLNIIIHDSSVDNLNADAGAKPYIRLHELYGQNQYKCSRISCKFFYQGFDSKLKRDEHIAKHERMYFCSFPGCPMSTLGCVTAADLRKHEREKHNMTVEDGEFPDPNLDKEEKVFICSECGNRFTRKHNLNLHMRVHERGDKAERLACRYCSQTFGRNGDRTRHESTQHAGSKEFKCGGQLEDGT